MAHHALQYACNKRDIHGKVARCMDFLSEHGFGIKYRPGASNNVAEYLVLVEVSAVQDNDSSILSVFFEGPAFEDLQQLPIDTENYILGFTLKSKDPRKHRTITRNAKDSMVWNLSLFRETKSGILVMLG